MTQILSNNNALVFEHKKKHQARDDRQENSVIWRMSNQKKNCKGSTQDLFFLYEAKGKFLTLMLANKSLKCLWTDAMFTNKYQHQDYGLKNAMQAHTKMK